MQSILVFAPKIVYQLSSLNFLKAVAMDGSWLVGLGFALVILGLILIIAVSVLMYRRKSAQKEDNESKTDVAGVIMIGPIPIIFGNNKKALKSVTILAIILTILLIILTVLRYLW